MNELLPLKTASRCAVALMAVLLAGTIIFFKERMLFSDSCFILFEILNKHQFFIQEFRYGSFITQVVPLLGGDFHLPLNVIMMAYSISFNLFYFIVVVLLVIRFKQYGLAILMSLYHLLFVSDTFFWPNNEVHQGIAWMFLFWGVFLNKKQDVRQHSLFSSALLIALAFLAISSHYVVIIPFTFLWLYFWMEKDYRLWYGDAFRRFSIPLAALAFLRVVLIPFGHYDKGRLSGVKHIKINPVLYILHSQQFKTFLSLCLTNYWLVVIILIAGLISLAVEKKYLLASLTLIYTVGYFILMCLVFSAFNKKQLFYMESEWMGLSIIIATPFVYSFLTRLKMSQSIVIVCVIFIVRLVYIGISAPVFMQRLAFVETTTKQIEQKKLSKVVVLNNQALDDTLLMNWGVAIESLFCSKLNGDNPQISFVIISEDEIGSKVPHDRDVLLTGLEQIKSNALNPAYFQIDTTKSYYITGYGELMGH